MSSLGDEFPVYLPSNVKGNPRNKPSLYETELAKPLDLYGDWDVDLTEISYPHNWPNLDNTYKYFVLKLQLDTADTSSDFEPDAAKDQMDLYDVIMKSPIFYRLSEVDSEQVIEQGNDDLSKIMEIIQRQLVGIFGIFKPTNLKFNPNQYRFEINSTVTFAIAF